jgi:biotin transport system substrate-specific component
LTAITAPRNLVDTLPVASARVRSIVAVVGFALLTAAAAQVSFALPWTPVPLTGQTFAVLVAGAALGARRAIASQGLYVVLGAVGLPFYADASGGWKVATGATAGYLVGFIIAAGVVGRLADKGDDRRPLSAWSAMLAGTAIIYACGATWLAHHLGVSAVKAVELGVAPFLIGDALKAVAAGVALPTAWRLVRSPKND